MQQNRKFHHRFLHTNNVKQLSRVSAMPGFDMYDDSFHAIRAIGRSNLKLVQADPLPVSGHQEHSISIMRRSLSELLDGWLSLSHVDAAIAEGKAIGRLQEALMEICGSMVMLESSQDRDTTDPVLHLILNLKQKPPRVQWPEIQRITQSIGDHYGVRLDVRIQ